MSRSIKNFRTVMSLLLAGFNIAHIFWTVWAIACGGDLEIMALLPWIFIEIPSVFVVIAEAIFLIFARRSLQNCKFNVSMLLIYVTQVVVFNALLFA